MVTPALPLTVVFVSQPPLRAISSTFEPPFKTLTYDLTPRATSPRLLPGERGAGHRGRCCRQRRGGEDRGRSGRRQGEWSGSMLPLLSLQQCWYLSWYLSILNELQRPLISLPLFQLPQFRFSFGLPICSHLLNDSNSRSLLPTILHRLPPRLPRPPAPRGPRNTSRRSRRYGRSWRRSRRRRPR